MYRKIATDTLAIGVTDNDLKLFENQYPLPDGVTYNSYIITNGGKTAIIDSVDQRCGTWWNENILAAAGSQSIDYLVVQHMEPDHSSMLDSFLHNHPETILVLTKQAAKMVTQFFEDCDLDGRTMVVTDGDTLEIGNHKLTFATAPMVHWPEVMVTYDTLTGVVFTADAFGTFGTSDEFHALWPNEARRYYANIVGKYGQLVGRLLQKLEGIGTINLVAPLHGPVITADEFKAPLALYKLWSSYEPEIPDGVLVAYASIYGNTEETALYCASQLEQAALTVRVVNLCDRDVSYAVAQAFRMGKILLAAPTYDGGLFPAMHNFLYHLQIKGLRNRTYGIIENGTWAPAAGRIMREMVAKMPNSTIIDSTVSLKSTYHSDNQDTLDRLLAALKNKA